MTVLKLSLVLFSEACGSTKCMETCSKWTPMATYWCVFMGSDSSKGNNQTRPLSSDYNFHPH